LLIRAAIQAEVAAIDAWQTWKTEVEDIENLDEGSYWVFPRLYRNLQRLGIEDPLMQRLKGVYRHVWSRNQMMLRALELVVQELQAVDIDPLLLRGAALITLPGEDVGVRRADDSGIGVAFESVPKAVAQLQKLGWQPSQLKAPESLRSQQHALGFHRHDGLVFTLYWRPLPECFPLCSTAKSQEAQISVCLGQTFVEVPSPTEQLFYSCICATRWQLRPPFYWLADAAALIQCQPIDWVHLLHLAKQYRLSLSLRRSLTLIAAWVACPGLNSTLQQLQNLPIASFESVELWAKGRSHPLLGQLPSLWFEHQRLIAASPTEGNHPQAFGQFLQQRWGLPSLWQLPLHIGKQGAKRVYQAVLGDRA
jgi:hypothetical protein